MTLRQSSITVSRRRGRALSAIFRLVPPALDPRAPAGIEVGARAARRHAINVGHAEPSFSRSDSFVTLYNVHDERVARAQVPEGNARLLLLLPLLLVVVVVVALLVHREEAPVRRRAPRQPRGLVDAGGQAFEDALGIREQQKARLVVRRERLDGLHRDARVAKGVARNRVARAKIGFTNDGPGQKKQEVLRQRRGAQHALGVDAAGKRAFP